ncbi:MAG: electron transport complex subunit E [Clostridia bacterium]|nr:electron transport complex subunit E [Clostridia bacterium]MBR5284646.1 electron transport complex subunit E [Clostridia bacterium]
MNNFKQQLKEGILTNNPIFVQLIGLCSTLAVSTTLANGLGMGLAVTIVLMCSNLVISLLRKIIPNQIRIAAFIVVIAGFVTIVDLSMQAWLPELSESLGIFIPLIVVNCLILARAEAFASKNGPIASLIDGLTQGVGFTIAISLISAVRELIGSGSLLGVPVFTESYTPVIMIILPAGGFLTLGILMAVFQYFTNKYSKKEEN